MNDFNQKIIEEFRANGGVVGGNFAGATLVLLTTTGARTGKRTTSPTMYLKDGDRYIIIASNGGGDRHPAWYHNLLATPQATAEIGTETFEVKASVIEGEERDELYARVVEIAPAFAQYEAMTTRRIPVLALHRV